MSNLFARFPSKTGYILQGIYISLKANGNSSYRDAVNLACMTIRHHKNYKIPLTQYTICIITDNMTEIVKHLKLLYHMYELTLTDVSHIRIQHVKNKCDFINYLTDNLRRITAHNDYHSVLLSISAHGYTKRASGIYINMETNHKSEYLKLGQEIIYDHELTEILYKNLNSTIECACLIDTCHSGTMLNLDYISSDGIIYKRTKMRSTTGTGNIKHIDKKDTIDNKSISIPKIMAISSCNDNEMTGEDIGTYAGWGGKLITHFIDYVLSNTGTHLYQINLGHFFIKISTIFKNQKYQQTRPMISFTPPSILI